jgi:hypothetical protein
MMTVLSYKMHQNRSKRDDCLRTLTTLESTVMAFALLAERAQVDVTRKYGAGGEKHREDHGGSYELHVGVMMLVLFGGWKI